MIFGLLTVLLVERFDRGGRSDPPGTLGLILRVTATLGWLGVSVALLVEAINSLTGVMPPGEGPEPPFARLIILTFAATIIGQFVSAWVDANDNVDGKDPVPLTATGIAAIGTPLVVGTLQTVQALASIISRIG